jgi:hypothetical protein
MSGHVMSRTRVATNQRELLRTAPDLLHRMARTPAQLAPAPAITFGGTTLPALRYASAFGDMVVAFDSASGLPALIRQLDYDPIQADSDFDLRLADWREVAGWRYPFEQRYELNGSLQRGAVVQARAAADDQDHGSGARAHHRYQLAWRVACGGVAQWQERHRVDRSAEKRAAIARGHEKPPHGDQARCTRQVDDNDVALQPRRRSRRDVPGCGVHRTTCHVGHQHADRPAARAGARGNPCTEKRQRCKPPCGTPPMRRHGRCPRYRWLGEPGLRFDSGGMHRLRSCLG